MAKQKTTLEVGSLLRTLAVALAIIVGAALLANAKITITVDHIIQPLETLMLDETDATDDIRARRAVQSY